MSKGQQAGGLLRRYTEDDILDSSFSRCVRHPIDRTRGRHHPSQGFVMVGKIRGDAQSVPGDRATRNGTGWTVRAGHYMRVLLQGRSARSIAANPGGDQVQLEATASGLRAEGVDALVSAEATPNLSGFDAVHLFGLVRPQETWVQARNAHRQGKPIFLSTVYCDVWEFERVARSGPVGWVARHSTRDAIEALKAMGRGINNREWSSRLIGPLSPRLLANAAGGGSFVIGPASEFPLRVVAYRARP